MPCDFCFSVALISLIKQCVTLVTVIKTTYDTRFVHETTSDHCFLNKTTCDSCYFNKTTDSCFINKITTDTCFLIEYFLQEYIQLLSSLINFSMKNYKLNMKKPRTYLNLFIEVNLYKIIFPFFLKPSLKFNVKQFPFVINFYFPDGWTIGNAKHHQLFIGCVHHGYYHAIQRQHHRVVCLFSLIHL